MLDLTIAKGDYLSSHSATIESYILAHKHSVLVGDTGIGKTALFLDHLDPKRMGKHIIFLVPYITLGQELVGDKLYYDGKPPALIDDDYKTVVVVYDTLRKIPDDVLEKSIVVVDEVHLLAHSAYRTSLPFIFDRLTKHHFVMLTGTYVPEVFKSFQIDGHIKAVKTVRRPINIINYLCEQTEQVCDEHQMVRKEHRDEVHINAIIDITRRVIAKGHKAYIVIDNAKVIEQVISGLSELNCIYRVGKRSKYLADTKEHDRLYNNGHIDSSVDVIIGTNVLAEGLSLYSEHSYDIIIGGYKSSLMMPDRLIQVCNRQRNIGEVTVHIERYIPLKPMPPRPRMKLADRASQARREMGTGSKGSNQYHHFNDDGSISPLHKVKIIEESYHTWSKAVEYFPTYDKKWLQAIKDMAGDSVTTKTGTLGNRTTAPKEVLVSPKEALLALFDNPKFDTKYQHPNNIQNDIDEPLFADVVSSFTDDLTAYNSFILVLAEAKQKLNKMHTKSLLNSAGESLNTKGVLVKKSLNDIKQQISRNIAIFKDMTQLHRVNRALLGVKGSVKVKNTVNRLPKKLFGNLTNRHKSLTNIKQKNGYAKSIANILKPFGLIYNKALAEVVIDEDVYNADTLRAKTSALLDDEMNSLQSGEDKRWSKKSVAVRDANRLIEIEKLREDAVYWNVMLFNDLDFEGMDDEF